MNRLNLYTNEYLMPPPQPPLSSSAYVAIIILIQLETSWPTKKCQRQITKKRNRIEYFMDNDTKRSKNHYITCCNYDESGHNRITCNKSCKLCGEPYAQCLTIIEHSSLGAIWGPRDMGTPRPQIAGEIGTMTLLFH